MHQLIYLKLTKIINKNFDLKWLVKLENDIKNNGALYGGFNN